jgi:hypothetical protein
VAEKAKKKKRKKNTNDKRNGPVAQKAKAEGTRKEGKNGPAAQKAKKRRRDERLSDLWPKNQRTNYRKTTEIMNRTDL